MKRIAIVLMAFVVACGSAFGKLAEQELTPDDVGTVLRHNTIYHVRKDITLDASDRYGVSALRVPVLSAAIIDIDEGCTLTVKGGPGYGEIGGGAGIEVPAGAKLVVCGKGALDATGGAAAAGAAASRGLSRRRTSMANASRTMPIARPTTACSRFSSTTWTIIST